MAKTRFSINKETLIEEQEDGYILTRVPNSNMEYYLLFTEDEIFTEDKETLIVEWDSDKELNVLPRVNDTQAKDGTRRPTLEEAIAEQQDSVSAIPMKASELYKDYYHYDKTKDPEVRAKEQRIREQKRREALERADNAKKQIQTAKNQGKNIQAEKDTPVKENSQDNAGQKKIPQSPSEAIEQQRRQMKHYTKEQFREIRRGVSQNLDTSLYRNIDLSSKQMRELRLALKAGMDVTKFNSPFISAKHMKELRVGAKKGVRLDLEKLDQSLYNAEQIHELRLGFEKKLNMNNYLNPVYSAAQMRELRLGQQAGFDTKGYEDLHLTAAQMHSIRQKMVMDNIGEIIKRMCEDIRQWLSEKIERIAERLKARYQNREPMTPEQIKDARINEAVRDIKETLVQSELLSESAYENKEIDHKIKEQLKELADYAEKNPEQSLDQPAKEAAMGVCTAAGAEMDNLKEEKVVSIRDNEETMNIEEAVEQAIQQAYEMDEMIEEETFEMMQ